MNIRIGFVVVASAVALVGCGGVVNYTPDGGEGGSGANGGGGAGANGPNGPNNSNSNSNSNTTDVVSTGPQNTCELFCAQFADCTGGPADCFEACESFYVPGCEPQADVYLQCLITEALPDCSFSEDLCSSQLASYNQCLNQSACFTEECSSGGGECQCFGECNGYKVEQYCFASFGGDDATGTSVGAGGGGEAPPPQEFQCDCYLDGSFAGSCFDDFDACSLEQGCCQQYTFDFNEG